MVTSERIGLNTDEMRLEQLDAAIIVLSRKFAGEDLFNEVKRSQEYSNLNLTTNMDDDILRSRIKSVLRN